ncbi:MAG: MBL fold metallo-hydrolase [Deltaproteobacteria bacterium]|nr:MBL fold metallo-hydrolase [Deltaproteobacteria bacterium]
MDTTTPTNPQAAPLVHRMLGMNPSVFTGEGTNTYLVGGFGADPLLIDTGSGVEAWTRNLEAYLAAHRLPPPARCLLTHAHPDHIGGAVSLAQRFPTIRFYKFLYPDWDSQVKTERGPLEISPLGDGDSVSGEGYILTAVHTPGHAPDHLCFVLREENACFTGDMVLGKGTTFIPRTGGNLAVYLESLKTLGRLDLTRIYPGHGPLVEDPAGKIAGILAHRQAREDQIMEALAKGGLRLTELTGRIYAGYPPDVMGMAGQMVESHLMKLLEDGLVVLSGGEGGIYYRVFK